MTTAYSNLLGLALPVTGELSGTWGDTVNDYITKYLDDAIANAQVISGSQTAVTLSKTTGTALVAAGSGSTGSAQYALIRCTGNPASTLTITVSYSSLTNSQFSKTYLIFNSTSTNQSVVVQATTSSGTSTGVTITAGERALIAWNGTDFVKIATQSGTGEFVTVDTTNLEVTNIKAKDGTAAATIADSTGAITVSTLLNVDNLRLDGNTLSSTDSNGNVVLAPNGTGDVQLDADTVRVGDSAAAVTLTSNGAGALTVTTGGAADLILNTNSGTNSGSITIGNGTNGNITVATNGTGDFYVDADTVRIGDSNANATITTNGTGDLILNTNSGTNSGSITIEDGVNGNIIIAPNGTGQVQITNAALDLTTIEVTNIKAKDGTASMTLADTTGIITLSATAGTANGVLYLNGSRAVTSGSALTFDGSTFNVTGAASVTGTNSLSLQRPVVPSFLGQGAPAITWQFYSTGTTYTVGASIQGLADAAWTSTSAPTSIRMYTVPSGSTSLSERLRIAAGGQVNIGGNFDSTNNTLQVTGNAAIGYTTAAPTTGLIVAGNVGIGTDSPNISGGAAGSKIVTVSASAAGRNGILELNGTRSTSGDYVGYVRFFNNAAATPGADIQAIRGASDTEAVLAFATSGTERARIEAAGNLILRQSSNAANTSVSFNTTVQDALTLDSSGRLGVGTGSPAARFNVESGDILLRGGQLTIGPTAGGNGAGAIRSTLNGVLGSLIFQTEDSNAALVDRMTLDSSGNLGLGVTPNANWTDFTVFQNNQAAFLGYPGQTHYTQNAYYQSGAWKYISTNAATRYTQLTGNGEHQWFTAPSGTANTAITFTQAMTLDASGNLAIGRTSATYRLDVEGTGVAFRLKTTAATTGFIVDQNNSDSLVSLINYENAAIRFGTNATERARITSGGYFKASSTGGYESGTGNFHEFRASANDTQTTTFSHTAASPYGIVVRYTGAAPNNTDNWFWYCDDNSSTQRASLKSNGGLYNYQANDSNLSDRREKTNFAPAGPYLSKICAIPVQTFNYIDQNMEEDPGTTLGVVAQDVQAIAPELVMESNWGTEENPKMRLSIYQTDLQYALMKCIQEQQAMIDELKAEVAALKGA